MKRIIGVLGVVGVLLAAALVWLLVRGHPNANAGLRASEQAALDAASREMVDVQSFRLAHFDADFARATNGLTGDVRKALTAKKQSLESGLKTSKHDTSATVTQAAFEETKNDNIVVLMTMNNYRVDAKGAKTLFGSGRFEVTVSRVNGTWLVSDFTSVGLI
jgi:Mce-associated membrane protein